MRKATLLCLAAIALLCACHQSNDPIRLQGQAQGTYYNIVYFDDQHRDLRQAIDSLLHEFDRTASLWEENSVIRRVNGGQDSIINPMFADLLRRSEEIHAYTQGAFNCKIGAIVNLYGFGFKNREDVSDKTIDSLVDIIANDKCEINGTDTLWVTGKSQGIEFDFNAIAQGYSVDLLAKMFEDLDIHNYLIDVGGEVIAKGTKPNGDNWVVGIEKPAENKYSEQEVETRIYLKDKSVVTSGNYRKYYEKDGVRYSHTINPATGRPVEHSLLSVSVISNESWYADAMATAFMVMGLEKALQFIEQHPENEDIQAVYFIYDDGGKYKTYATTKFKEYIKEN